ncbi:MAG: hypothetical protein ACP5E9_03875 [Candidatus Methanospirareceae archaeon]
MSFNLIVDLDPEGEILGIELLAEKIDLSRFRTIELFEAHT